MDRMLLIAAILTIVGCKESPVPDRAEVPPPPQVAKVTYKLDAQFNELTTSLLQDDAAVFASSGDALASRDMKLVPAEAVQVARLYADNQVAGDQRYFKKRVFLTGKIDSINSSLGNSPYVVFRGTGFAGLQGHLSFEDAAEAATFKKGQTLALVCTGAGAVAGTPIFNSCETAEKLGRIEANKLARELEAFARGEHVSDMAAVLAVHCESMARTIDDGRKCGKGCEKLVDDKRANLESRRALIKSMREGGLQITPGAEAQLNR